MANPQPDQFTKISNELMENIPYFKFNGTQLRILFAILRYTYGFSRKSCELSLKFLADATGIHKDQVKRELNTLIKANVIKVVKEASFNSTREIGFNKDYDQWDIENSRVISIQGTNLPTGGENTHQERKNLKENYKEIYIAIFDHWNSKGIIKHKKLTDKTKRKIKSALKDYDVDDLKKIIDTYAEVALGEKYWFDYKWTLEEFLQRGVMKFENREVALQNYIKDEYKDRHAYPQTRDAPDAEDYNEFIEKRRRKVGLVK